MVRATFIFLVISLLLPALLHAQGRGFGATRKNLPAALREGTYRALVIGNDRYQDPRRLWRPLKTAVADARAVARVLKVDYGFRTYGC